MKRLQPLALIVESADKCLLRCRPKLDQITEEEHADLFRTMRHRAINESACERNLEAEFPFTFNEDRGVLQDSVFFSLTGLDDYGELWIDRAVGYLAWAHEEGVELPDSSGEKSRPHTILVDESNTEATRRYKVIFSVDNDAQATEHTFTVEGTYDDRRTIAWQQGSYSASWERKSWIFNSPAPVADLERLLLAIIRLDEAIHLELMMYAKTEKFDSEELEAKANYYSGFGEEVVCTVPENYLAQLHDMGLFTSHPLACFSGGVYVVKPVTTIGNNIAGYSAGYISLGDEPLCPKNDAPMLRLIPSKWNGMWHVNGQDCSGGMGPADFVNEWATPEEAIADIRDFFFGDPKRMEAKGAARRDPKGEYDRAVKEGRLPAAGE